jgi:hypothetical protein
MLLWGISRSQQLAIVIGASHTLSHFIFSLQSQHRFIKIFLLAR